MKPSFNSDLTKVGEIAAKVPNALVGGPFGSNLVSRDYVSSGVPVIRGQNMSRGRWIGGDFVFVSSNKANQLSANIARPGDLVFTQRGTLGQVSLVPPEPYDYYIVSQSQMKLTVDQEKVDAHFIYYLFQTAEQQSYIRRNAIQTGVPHTNLAILRDTPLRLPPLEEQKRIAHILGTLDDKIELNRRMNATLEQMARALFKSWFVDFDPVRLRMEYAGRTHPTPDNPTGIPPEVLASASLSTSSAGAFPAEFCDSDFGQIPVGWSWETIGAACSRIFSGGTPSTSEPSFWNGMIPWLSSGETSSTIITRTHKRITPAGVRGSSTREARAGCTVIASAGQGHTRGQTAFLGFDCYINQSVVALEADPSRVSDGFLFRNLEGRYDEFRRVSDSHSSRGSLTTKILDSLPLLIPSRDVISHFDAIHGRLLEQSRVALLESELLKEVRKSLLGRFFVTDTNGVLLNPS